MTSVLTRTSGRMLPVALAGVLVLGACGSDDNPEAAEGDTVPPAADGLLSPVPVRTAGGGGAGGVAAAETADSRMSTDMMLPYQKMNFVAGEGLPALPTNSTGYVFQMGAAVTAEQVSSLAAALGVEGEPVRIDEGYGVSWRVGPDDGTAPSVYVYEDAQLSWNYNSAWATSPAYAGCVVAESSPGAGADGEVAVAPDDGAVAEEPPVDPAVSLPVGECVEPEPPAGVPSVADAEARTRELMTQLGLDPEGFTFEPYGDEWFASVSAVEQLDGLFAGRRVDVGFGGEGVMQYASGQLAQPQPMGPYPLIGLDEALARLNDPSGFYGGGMSVMDMARSTTAGDVAVSSDAAVGAPVETAIGETPAPESMPPESVPVETVPVETVPPESVPVETVPVESVPVETVPVEELTVTLVDVQADVWWAWDVDGSVYLLPAYRFIGDDGGWYTVPAVTDEFLIQAPVEPMPEPMPVEPMPVETVPAEPVPGEPATFDTSLLESSIGTSLGDFTAAANALGAEVRVTVIDGVEQAATMDYNPMRVNVAVEGSEEDAVVVAIVSVG